MEIISKKDLGIDEKTLDTAVNSICSDIALMTFGSDHVFCKESLHYFTDTRKRKTLKDPGVVWYKGNPRFPIINRQTGTTSIFMNTDVLKLALSSGIAKVFKKKYRSKNLIFTQGPPSVVIKPYMADQSSGQCFIFDSDKVSYTGFLCMTENDETIDSGQIEILENFNGYYDILSEYFNFPKHLKNKEILYLESWFSVSEANEIIKFITALYNYEFRELDWKLDEKTVPKEIHELYNKFVDRNFEVPEHPRYLKWKRQKCSKGTMILIDNKTVIRTASSKDEEVRIYLPIVLQPKSMSVSLERLLHTYYEKGKIGDWSKPGVRHFTRSNRHEYDWRQSRKGQKEGIEKFLDHSWTEDEKIRLGIDSSRYKLEKSS